MIVGVGTGLSASLARRWRGEGHDLVLAARGAGKLASLAAETGAQTRTLDATDPAAVAALFETLDRAPRVVVYNPSARVRGPIAELDPEEVRRAVEVTAFGAFLTGQAAARRMLDAEPRDGVRGTILFTGASAGVKGFPQSAPSPWASSPSAGWRSMARELHPKGIHVAWVNIDGAIRNPGRQRARGQPRQHAGPRRDRAGLSGPHPAGPLRLVKRADAEALGRTVLSGNGIPSVPG